MTAGTFTPAERSKLVAILARLGSDFDGERAAAGLLASRMVRAKGLDWSDLIGPGLVQHQPQHQTGARPQSRPNDGGDLSLCLRHVDELTDWEFGFVQSLASRARRSVKQLGILRGIAADLRKRGFV